MKNSIGFAIAEKFAKEGANVVVSSRKQKNVDKAVKSLTSQGLSVIGCVCHVGKKEHRQKMIDLVGSGDPVKESNYFG